MVGFFGNRFRAHVVGPAAHAQQPGKIFRIGILDPSTASGSAILLDAFRRELNKLGWIEGKNISIEYRFAEQKPERMPEIAADLVRLKVDLIVATGTTPPLAAKSATMTIPIVMTNAGDPVGVGLVANLARPRGNVTGELGFESRADYQEARGTQRCYPKARPNWTSGDAGRQCITPAERAQGCGCGTEAKVGGDHNSI